MTFRRMAVLCLLLMLPVGTMLGAQKKSKKDKDAQTVSDTDSAGEPVEDPAVTELTASIYQGMLKGHVDEAVVTPELEQRLNSAGSRDNQEALTKMGALQRLELERRERTKLSTKYMYMATFANTQKHVVIVLAPNGKVMEYLFTL